MKKSMEYSNTYRRIKRGNLIILLALLFIIFSSVTLIKLVIASYNIECIDARPGIYIIYFDSISNIEINVTYNSLHKYTQIPMINVTLQIINGSKKWWGVFSSVDRSFISGNIRGWRKFPLWMPRFLKMRNELEIYDSIFEIEDHGNYILAFNGTVFMKYDKFSGALIEGVIIINGLKFHVKIKETNMNVRRNEFAKLYYDWYNLTRILIKLNESYSSILKVYSIGKSCLGRDIWVCEFPARKGKEGVVIVDGGMHGSEVIGVNSALYVIMRVIKDYYELKELDNITLIVIPMLNPDGVEASKILPSKPPLMLKYARCNARGVDLNRNFKWSWKEGGSSEFEHPTFRGENPETEPEVNSLLKLFINRRVLFYINLHSGIDAILIPGYNLNPYRSLYREEIAYSIARIFGYSIRMGAIYGGAANWIIFKYNYTAFSIIIELYGNPNMIKKDWFYFYNPSNKALINKICDNTYYAVKYVLSNVYKWIENIERGELRAHEFINYNYIIIITILIIIIIVLIMYLMFFRKVVKST